jgi:peptidoglycan lytic transglycosylase
MFVSPLPAAMEGAAPQPTEVFSFRAAPLGARRKPRLIVRGRRLNVLADHAAVVSGAVRPRLRHVRIALQALDGRRWVPVAHAVTGARGRFRIHYAPRATGSWHVQLRVKADGRLRASSRRLGRLSSYRLAAASWYGGYGETACGSYLTSSTMGVANKTLPCGTPVTIRYRGRTVDVDVIDRGPYVAGREFDLTEATKTALGFEGVADVWATR